MGPPPLACVVARRKLRGEVRWVAVHIHPRSMGGRETLEPDACAAAIEAIRDQCPGLPIGLTTGLWIVGDSARRHALINSWTVLPEFCSVNFAEPGTEELCDLLLSKGIAVEAGLSSIADARIFVESPFRERCLRVLIEIEPGGPDDPVKSAAAISRILDAGGVRPPRCDSAWLRPAHRPRGYVDLARQLARRGKR